MRTHTNEFKEELKVFGRQIQGKIVYYPSYDLVSESDDNILTEANLQIISEQTNYDEPIEIDAEDIFSISIIKNGDLLQSLMKEFDFETKEELNIGSVVNPQLGLLVNETYEYLDYGNYIINSKEFNMDTETWNYVCYDKMLFSMVKYRGLSNVQYPITIKQFINNLCNKVGLEFEDSTFVNQGQLIYEDLYKNRDVTYRDIFDEISKIVAGNLLINDSDKLEVSYPSKASYSENASGSDITIEAVEEPILNVKLEGDTQQEDIPTPTNPKNIEIVTGEQNIKIQGANLFNYKDTFNVTTGVIVDEEGWITVTCDNTSGTSAEYFNYFTNNLNLLTGTNYNIIVEVKSVSGTGRVYSCSYYVSQGQFLQNRYKNFSDLTNNSAFAYSAITKSVFPPTGGTRSFVQFATGQSGSITFRISVIKDLTITPETFVYREYQEQNYPINLGNIELCKIGDYQDYIYKQNGNWYIHKVIDKVVLNGTETNVSISKSGTVNWFYSFKNLNQNTPGEGNGYVLSNYYKATTIYTSNTNEGICVTRTSKEIRIRYGQEDTLSNFLNWVSNHNIEVYYVMASPTDTQITDTTLIQQLDNLKNATLFNGANNISVDGDLPSILNLDYISEYESINEDYLKDTNVRMAEKVGVINSVAILDSESNLQFVAEDTQSIKENQMTRVTITDNLIAMNGETQEIANNILSKLNGLYYYANDLQTTGVCYYDFLDMFNVEARGNIYQCLLLNNEITITQGIEEHIFTDKFEEIETNKEEYTTSVLTNKQASLKINQQDAEIQARVEKNGIISAINLSPEEIQIEANKISLEGKEINLTSDDIIINSTNFSVNKQGKITASSGKIAGFQIDDEKFFVNVVDKYTYTSSDIIRLNEIIDGSTPTEEEYEKYDINGDGILDRNDLLQIQSKIFGYGSTEGEVFISTNDANEVIILKGNGNGYNTIIGMDKVTCDGLTARYANIAETITCTSLTQTSLKEKKKNFERLTNAKDILNQVDIYKYNFKDEEDNIKKSIGFVIGDDFNYSKEITSTNNDGANIYSMVSVLWQVVKEQQEEINQLKEMIKNGKY